MKTLKSRSLAYDFVWPVGTGFPAVLWSTIAVSFSRCGWLFPPSAREVSPGNRSNYKSTRERVDSKGLYERWRLHLIGSWLLVMFTFTLSNCFGSPGGNWLHINVLINWQLSKQGIRWPVSPESIVGTGVHPSRSSTFLKLSADKLLVFKWSQVQVYFFKNLHDICCVYVTMAPHY